MKKNQNQINLVSKLGFLLGFISLTLTLQGYFREKPFEQPKNYPVSIRGTQPLVMKGGNPYIRALMRTITASEANVAEPYHVIYGGSKVTDLTTHPNRCIPITVGVNQGKCSTASGRYQMLNFVWDEKAALYHPHPNGLLWWKQYSFEPEYQDAVVYGWLSDRSVWGADLTELLKAGEIETVLKLLSGTWTSLGYGIETNSMSRYLPEIYQNMLQEELS